MHLCNTLWEINFVNVIYKMLKIAWVWMTIWLGNAQLSNSSGKLNIRFLRFKNNKRVNNNDCCDNVALCYDPCDVFLEICVTEVGQVKCNSDKFKTKVLGEGSFTFDGDLGNGKANPLEYSFQKWQGFSLAIEIWDYDSDFLKGSNDFVDNVHLDIKEPPNQDLASASRIARKMKSATSPTKRYIDLEISIYCDNNFFVPDCDKECIPRDDALGHYTCDYVRGLYVCNEDWYGDNCTLYCKPRNDTFGHYSCDEFGAKVCAADWFGVNCSTFCRNAGNLTGHYTCDASTGRKICRSNWFGENCGNFCRAQDRSEGHYSCNQTSGGKVCLKDWYGTECTKYCSPQDSILGHFKCDVNGNKFCLSGWRGANCTMEIPTSDESTVLTVVPSNYNMQHSLLRLLSRTTERQTQSIFEKSTSIKTSLFITVIRSRNINQPDLTTSLHVVVTPVTRKQNTPAVMTPSLNTSTKRFSTTREVSFLSKTTPYKYYKPTQTISESSSQSEETFQITETTNSRLFQFSTMKTFNPKSLSKTNSVFSSRSSTPLMEYNLHPRTSIVELSNFLLNSTAISKRTRNKLTSTQAATTQIREVTVASPVTPVLTTRSSIMTSFSPGSAKRTASSVSRIPRGPVSVKRSVVPEISITPGSLTRPVVMTSSSIKPTRSGGKAPKKKDNQFVVVFFPSVCFMMVVGLGMFVKIRQKNLTRVKIMPAKAVPEHLHHPEERSTRTSGNHHRQPKQDVMQMDTLTTKK